MNKKDRQKIFDKYNGRCAYCGCKLQKGWHVDEIEPIRRSERFLRDENGKILFDEKFQARTEKYLMHPENLNIENQNPACASCNINKHSMSLEEFRQLIAQFIQSLNLYSTQYKIAKRYGLLQETNLEVKFYFETIND